MTSVNELNAYQRGMREGMRVGEQKQNNDVLAFVKIKKRKFLEENKLGKAKAMSYIINKFI